MLFLGPTLILGHKHSVDRDALTSFLYSWCLAVEVLKKEDIFFTHFFTFQIFFVVFFLNNVIYLFFLAVLGLRCCVGYSLGAVCRLLVAVVFLAVSTGSRCEGSRAEAQ